MLKESLHDSEAIVLIITVEATGKIRPEYNEEVISAMIKALHDDNWRVQIYAIKAIANCGFATNELKTALNQIISENNDNDLKNEALKALTKLNLN